MNIRGSGCREEEEQKEVGSSAVSQALAVGLLLKREGLCLRESIWVQEQESSWKAHFGYLQPDSESTPEDNQKSPTRLVLHTDTYKHE